MQKRMSLLLFPAALLLTGCTPEEKTMLLPQAASSGDEAENRTATGDFTVKKIYTYTYDTLPQLGKSAFLSGCGDNEIHILSLGGQESGEVLEYREVDYRYGFYDVAGDFWEIREDLSDSPGEEMAKDLYIERILPSPDGKQLLVYIRSSFWDRLIVRLYTLGEAEPLLLYEGTSEASDAIRGSFSPDGRWVTFDAGGASVSFNRLVPVYDCSRTASRDDAFWWAADTAARLLAPDQALYTPSLLHTTDKSFSQLWDAKLYSDGDNAGLISLFQESGSSLCIMENYFPPGQEITPDASLLDEAGALLQGMASAQTLLPDYQGTPLPHYKYSSDGAVIYCLSGPATLCRLVIAEDIESETVRDFPDFIWDFLPLPSGGILAALVQETRDAFEQNVNASPGAQYSQEDSIPAALQEYWGILSADLYLYPEGDGEGYMLYKNLLNLISMEYDDETGRILLETYENQGTGHRRCIVLEL
ncbi:MAG: hypothetical protein HFH95_11030 [Lachnospiraceae bacterium]|nr:hypothetical protein [uncultured Acetatifactor sp.]MCI8543827.1 hypothetical protein [Lachnospiraceae bacterium]